MSIFETIGITESIVLLLVFIVALAIWAHMSRDKPMEQQNEELNEARRLEAQDTDDSQ